MDKKFIALALVAGLVAGNLAAYNFSGYIIRPTVPSDSTVIYENDAAKKMDKAATAMQKAASSGGFSEADRSAINEGVKAVKDAKSSPLTAGIGFGVLGNVDGDLGVNAYLTLDKGNLGLISSIGYIPLEKDMEWDNGKLTYSVGLVYRFSL